MLFYSLSLKLDKDYRKILQETYGFEDSEFSETVRRFNQIIARIFYEDDKVFFIDYDVDCWDFIASVKANEGTIGHIIMKLQQVLTRHNPGILNFAIKEITAKEYVNQYERALQNEYVNGNKFDAASSLNMDYFNNSAFSAAQKIFDPRNMDKTAAIKQAKELMLGSDMFKELENIYCDSHPKEFIGIPVHYKINCVSKEAGYEIIYLLANALHYNKRVLGRRIDRVFNIEDHCYDEADFEQFVKHSAGEILVIELKHNNEDANGFASAYDRVINYFERIVKKYCSNTVFIFLEEVKKEGLSKKLMSSLLDKLSIVEISEGMGDKEASKILLKKLIEEKKLSEYTTKEDLDELLPENCYKASDLYTIANKWHDFCLIQKIYTAYSEKAMELKVEKLEEGNSIEELNNLVGLKRVKELTREIIAANVLDKRRSDVSKRSCQASKHMIFTGNPGSAKTTVARLIAKVLKENKVLKTGEFVECGRADLVGQYVGWTAKQVKNKFREAKGGILFIDEAYSLVDASKSFGEEAINTIVQEMENHRDDTIVIFAGYPERMKEFMDSNEGLRSRIAFQLDFPDYDAEELMGIFDHMLTEKDFSLTEDGKIKAKKIFEVATHIEDFGNGRLVRNILERAIMRQSVRLFNQGTKTISDEELFLLDADDIDDSLLTLKYEEVSCRPSIGFVA